jgi:hypothetical protein
MKDKLGAQIRFVSLASSPSVRSAQRMPVFIQCRDFRMSRPLRKHMAASVKVTLAVPIVGMLPPPTR